MQVAGIITEYNPLHSGHVHLMEEVRRLLGPETAVVCVMSGNFVQRGDFALVRRQARAKAAVESGADLVLELPLPWAVSSAERFADGGVQALMQWMEENIPYPQKLIRSKVQGDMEVTFIVDREGNVGEAKITKSLHPDLDKLVMAAMKRMPKWKPGKKDGRVSIVSVSLPIHFDAGAQQKNS